MPPALPLSGPSLHDILPADVLTHVLAALPEADLLALSCSCRLLHRLVEDPAVWRASMRRRHGPVIERLFGDALPAPPAGRSWREHALAFDTEWLALARAPAEPGGQGRLLLRMRSECAAAWPTWLGVPPSGEPLFTVRLPLVRTAIPVYSLIAAPKTFGVYDATSFAANHPGGGALIHMGMACAGDDCTDLFDAANHTEHARSILRALVVPGLEQLPEPPPLKRPQPSLLRRAAARAVAALRAMPHSLACFATKRREVGFVKDEALAAARRAAAARAVAARAVARAVARAAARGACALRGERAAPDDCGAASS